MHVDFETILNNFIKIDGGSKGFERFNLWVEAYNLDFNLPYLTQVQFMRECIGGLCESFRWAQPLIKLLRADDTAKYYKVRALTANVSMNKNDYSDVEELARSAPTMSGVPLNLNHDHSQELPYPDNRVTWAAYEDNAVEAIIRISNEQRGIQSMLENGDILNPSIEGDPYGGYRTEDGRYVPTWYRFTALALLEKDYTLPGDPVTYGFEPMLLNEGMGRSLVESLRIGEESEEQMNENTGRERDDTKELDDTSSYNKDSLDATEKKEAVAEGVHGMDVCGQCRFFEDLRNSHTRAPASTGEPTDSETTQSVGAVGRGVGNCMVTESYVKKQDPVCTDGRPRERATDLDRTEESIDEIVLQAQVNELKEQVMKLAQEKFRETEATVKAIGDLNEAQNKLLSKEKAVMLLTTKEARASAKLIQVEKNLEETKDERDLLFVESESAKRDLAFYKDDVERKEAIIEKQKRVVVELKHDMANTLVKLNDESTKRAEYGQRVINAEQEKTRLVKDLSLIHI